MARKRKLDNIERDVIRAERLGYGCHYGRYNADHPYTRVEEPEEIPEGAPSRICEHCGKLYGMAGRSHNSKFCSDACYYQAARKRAAIMRKAKKEAEGK